MFKFLFNRFRFHSFRVYYTYDPGTYVLSKVIQARSVYEANRLFDQLTDPRCRRLPDATVPL